VIGFVGSTHQVLIGPLHSEEQHHQAGGQQLPEEQDDPKDHIGFPIDLLCIRLETNTMTNLKTENHMDVLIHFKRQETLVRVDTGVVIAS